MIVKRNVFALTLALTFTILAGTACAQTAEAEKARIGWAARRELARHVGVKSEDTVQAAQTAESQQTTSNQANAERSYVGNNSGGLIGTIDRAKDAKRRALTGTWRIQVGESNTGLPPFRAYHTFGIDGTFTEVSDLLTTQAESPAHGVWDLDGDNYLLTFELFVFDEQKKPAGVIRVRCSIRLTGPDELAADTVVDFIDLEGNVAEAIDGGPFTGKRIKPLPLK